MAVALRRYTVKMEDLYHISSIVHAHTQHLEFEVGSRLLRLARLLTPRTFPGSIEY